MARPIEEIRLVGRDVELERIVVGLAADRPVSFVLAGAAGVGKSRLAAEAALAANRVGLVARQVTATQSAAQIPFAPFARFLPAADAAPADLLGLLRFVGDAVRATVSDAERLLLVVDDAHLLDEGSAVLIHQLVVSGSCRMIATMRPAAAIPDPVTALWKDGLAERIELDPLSEADVDRFAIEALGGPVAGAAVRRLFEASGGNPLWLRELLIGARAAGTLADDAGVWALRGTLVAPDRLAEIVDLRLDALAPETLLVVELLAAAEPLAIELLEACTGPGAVEDAERLGLVRVGADVPHPLVRLGHPIYGDVVRRRLPRARLRRLWGRLADAATARNDGMDPVGDELLRVVTWQLDAGRSGDPAQLSRAARRASQMSDKALAARLAQAALDAGGGVEAGLALAVAEFSSGRHDEAEELLASLVALCADDTETAQVVGARAYNLATLLGRPDDADRVIAEALAVVTESTARLRLLGRLATMRAFRGQPNGALDAAAPLLACDDDVMVGHGAYAASIAAWMLGRHHQAIALSRTGMAAHLRTADDHTQRPEIALIGEVLGHAGGGAAAQSLQVADRGYQACLTAGDQEGQATFSLLRGSALVAQGRLDDAGRAFREGASINRGLNDVGAQRWCLGGIALAEGMAGRAGPAGEAIAALDALPPGWIEIFELDVVERGRAWACAAAGELSRAADVLAAAATRAASDDRLTAEAVLRHDAVRLGVRGTDARRLRELAGRTDGDLVASYAEHAAASTGAELDRVSARFDSLGAMLLAAEASGAAAIRYRAEGLARAATAAQRRSVQLLAVCGGIAPPGLRRGDAVGMLTARESEIAGLAARGTSSRDIADRLVVSVRTVDNHLHSAYTKLGVTNRDQLARAMNLG